MRPGKVGFNTHKKPHHVQRHTEGVAQHHDPQKQPTKTTHKTTHKNNPQKQPTNTTHKNNHTVSDKAHAAVGRQ
jgi:hypothetical protein